MRFLEPLQLWWIAGAPLVLLLGWWAFERSRAGLARFFGGADARSRPWAPHSSRARTLFRSVLVAASVACLGVGLARPAYNPKPQPVQRSGRDVVFLVDVSRSMLATDLRPSRLERAKLAVQDALEAAQGERVGVVAFAGSAVVKCPLTTDFAFARLAIDNLSPESVSRGGTAIGDAIRTAQTLLESDSRDATPGVDLSRYRDIVILTDGEDHETNPLEAAREAAKGNIRIITIGLGSDVAGAPVPAGRSVLQYEGQVVKSRMNSDSLRQIAEATPGGRFFNVGTGSIELDSVYRRLMREAEQRSFESAPAMKYTEAFQAPLLAAFAFLVVEPLLSGRRSPRAPRPHMAVDTQGGAA
ncbi:MAG TPA: VWA domain-containing protein [Phycisphaerales bacterium]|nr:VWA domain-containing protein [Phycisphaerales bacterium]